MATKLTKSVTRESDVLFEGHPIVATLNPDMTVTVAVKHRAKSRFTIDLLSQYVNSRYMDSQFGKTVRKQFALVGKEIVVTVGAEKIVEDTIQLEENITVQESFDFVPEFVENDRPAVAA